MAINPNIPLQARTANIGDIALDFVQAKANKEDRTRRNRLLDLQTEQAETQLAEHKANAPTRALTNMNAREEARFKSKLHAALRVGPLLEAGDIEGARTALVQRREKLASEGIDTSDTDAILARLAQDPKAVLQGSRTIIQQGQQLGFLEAPKVQETFEPVKDAQGRIVGQRSTKTGKVVADPRAPEGTWSEPFNMGGALVQKNERTGQLRTAVSRPPQTTVHVDTTQDALAEALGKKGAEHIFKRREAALDAVNSIQGIREARQLAESGMATGAFANFEVALGNALLEAGINFNADAVKNTQAFAAAQAKQVASIIKQFGAGTGLSDADREFALKAAGGDITFTKDAILRILDINERASTNVVKAYQKDIASIPRERWPFDLSVQIPEAAPSAKEQPSPAPMSPINPAIGGIRFLGFEE